MVDDAIVLVGYADKLRNRGMDVQRAVAAAGATRLRPALLPAQPTVSGLLSMVPGGFFDFSK